jgi:pyruvate kinase
VRKAKILATLGPASREPQVLEALIAAGINGVRINMSHGTQDEQAENIKRAREAAERMKRPLAVLVDLSGPKIRTGVLQNGQPVHLEANSLFTITTRSVAGDAREVSTNYPTMARDVKPGARLLLDDGAIELHVERTTDTDVVCRVINGGTLGERKGINLPGIILPIPSLTDKDRRDLQWAVRQGADYIALSFVRRAEDCIEAKTLIKNAGGRAPLVAKIEKAEAIDHLDEIIAAADGLMVAALKRVSNSSPFTRSASSNRRTTRASSSSPRHRCCNQWWRIRGRRAPRLLTWRMLCGTARTA